MKTSLLGFLALFLAANLAQAQTPNAAIAKELQVYYEKGTAPPWAAAIKNLSAEKLEQRRAAAKYRVALEPN